MAEEGAGAGRGSVEKPPRRRSSGKEKAADSPEDEPAPAWLVDGGYPEADWVIPWTLLEIGDRLGAEAQLYLEVHSARYMDKTVVVGKVATTNHASHGKLLLSEEQVSRLQRLSHRNVGDFIGVFSHQGGFYTVSEYFRRGKSLKSILQPQPATPAAATATANATPGTPLLSTPADANAGASTGSRRASASSDELSRSLLTNPSSLRRVVQAIAAGMHYLHDKYGPHGVLTEASIVISRTGVAHITDYWLNGVLDHKSSHALHVAPELVGKPHDSSCSGDVYAFGVLVLRMLVGDSAAMTAVQRVAPMNTIDIDAVRHLLPAKAPADIADIAFQCLAARPELRPSMSDVCKRLQLAAGTSSTGPSNILRRFCCFSSSSIH